MEWDETLMANPEDMDLSWEEPLRQKLAGLPDQPGVYLYMDAVGKVIYVGKAKEIGRASCRGRV